MVNAGKEDVKTSTLISEKQPNDGSSGSQNPKVGKFVAMMKRSKERSDSRSKSQSESECGDDISNVKCQPKRKTRVDKSSSNSMRIDLMLKSLSISRSAKGAC